MKKVQVVSVKNMCFYIFLVLVLIYYAFRKVNVNYEVLDFTLYLAIPFFILKLLLEDTYTIKETVIDLSLIALGVISTLIISNTSILISFCVVIGMRNIDYKVALKIVFWIRVISCALIVIGVCFGLIQSNMFDRADGTVRNSMGYTHPNTFGIYCFVIVSLWFILYGEKKWKLKLFLSALLNIIQFYITNSRTSFLLITLFLIMMFVSKYKKNIRIFSKLSPYAMTIFFFVNLLMPLTLGTPIGNFLNAALSSRVSLSEGFIRVFGIDLLGKRIVNETGANGYYWHLDSGFLNLFIQFGAIIGAVYLILCFVAAKNTKTYNNNVHIAIIMFSLYGIIEDILSSMLFSYLWIIIGAAYYIALNKKKKGRHADILEKLRIKENKL